MPKAPHPVLVREVAQACREQDLIQPDAKVLVAVSAGADSTALAGLLAAVAPELGIGLELAYVDHGWRGAEEAAADYAAVAALGARLRVPTHRSDRPPADTPQSEDAARRWRYRSLSGIARRAGCTVVATGHHAGDQAETLLMRILRGSGMVGLAGIPPIRRLEPGDLQVIRPLLAVEPARLKAWLVEQGIAWREDHTNQDLSRDRAAIRARLAAHPAGSHRMLARLAVRLRRRLAWREAGIRDALEGRVHLYRDAGALAIDRSWLRTLNAEDLALLLRLVGPRIGAGKEGPWFTRTHLTRIQHLLDAEGAIDLPQSLHVHVRGHRAWLVRRDRPPGEPPMLSLKHVERAHFDLEAFLRDAGAREAAVDADLLGASPRIRRLRSGDRFIPQGRGGTSAVNISAWMSRRGLSRWVRRGQWVLEGEAGIAWVVGQRVDARHAVGARTRSVAQVRLA